MLTDLTDPLELLTLPQVSQLLKRSQRALERDIAAGELRTVKLGGSTRVPRMEVERFVHGDAAYELLRDRSGGG